MQNLSLKLRDNDKRLSDYGLPDPENNETELERALLEYDPHQQTILLHQLNAATPNTCNNKIFLIKLWILSKINELRFTSSKEWEVVEKLL